MKTPTNALDYWDRQRLAAFVEKRIEVASNGCWEWRGFRANGYGLIALSPHNARAMAHRAVHELMVGPLDPSLTLDHLCRNHGCVNPQHVEQVPSRTNTLRGVGVTAINAKKVKCKRGHDLSPKTGGGRRCLTCDRAHNVQRRKWPDGVPCWLGCRYPDRRAAAIRKGPL